jgi:hypothetical protein
MKWNGYLLAVLIMLSGFGFEVAAHTVVEGVVKDKSTGEPLSYVSVSFIGADAGGLTDDSGHFSIETDDKVDSLRIFMLGYKEVKCSIASIASGAGQINLEEEGHTLTEVSISAKNIERYRNKDNPAVELIRLVVEHKDRNYDKNKAKVNYDEYTKLQVSLLRSLNKIRANPNSKNTLSRLFMKADTTKVEGKASLPVIVDEKVFRHSFDAVTGKLQDTVLGEKKTSLDGIVDDDGLEAYLNKIYVAADIYNNNIMLGDQQLLSPIAGMGPEFYKYFITDTLNENGKQLVKMSFFPRNKADLLFKGDLLVDLQSYAVVEANLTLNKTINLNFVDDLKIKLQYSKSDNKAYYLQYSSLGMAMSIIGKNGGFYGEKITSIKDYNHIAEAKRNETYASKAAMEKPMFSDADWQEYRPQQNDDGTQNAYANLDTLKNTPSFKRSANLITLLLSGYEVLGPIEIGPINSFYSYNPVEGSRVKLGGRTTDKFSKRWMFEGHGAYGFKDKKWKYSAGVVYSLSGKSVAAFPMRNISVRRSFETQIPGQDLTFLEEDNFLLSFKRGDNDKWLYNNKWSVEYIHETENHLTFKTGFTHSIQAPAGHLTFQSGSKETELTTRENITISEFSGEIRWAPHEQFYQGKKFRKPVFNSYPVFTLRGSFGVKGLMKSEYTYQSVTLNVFKRFYLSQLGFSDVVLEGGRIFGKVPYPLLYIHKANQSYAYQLQSYNLMNFMEFMSDRYVSLNVDHSFNGFFLNKVPLVKKLKLREVASFKALYGDIGSNNRPGTEPGPLFNFPVNQNGTTVSNSLDKGPYIEASLGISNIFKILRVDVVRRFTYLNHPNVTPWGVRARMVVSL